MKRNYTTGATFSSLTRELSDIETRLRNGPAGRPSAKPESTVDSKVTAELESGRENLTEAARLLAKIAAGLEGVK